MHSACLAVALHNSFFYLSLHSVFLQMNTTVSCTEQLCDRKIVSIQQTISSYLAVFVSFSA
jgi:hypothetical protein